LRDAWIARGGDTESYAGRTPQARDEGAKHEARDAERLARTDGVKRGVATTTSPRHRRDAT